MQPFVYVINTPATRRSMPQEISSLTPRLICIGIDLIRMHCSAAGGVCALSTLKAEAKCDADAHGSARLHLIMSANCVIR
jgi:hypothetical protein